MCVCVPMPQHASRGQRQRVEFLPCTMWITGMAQGHQTTQQALLAAEPSCHL